MQQKWKHIYLTKKRGIVSRKRLIIECRERKVLSTHENTNIVLPFGMFSCYIIFCTLMNNIIPLKIYFNSQWVNIEIKGFIFKAESEIICVDPIWLLAYKPVQLFLTAKKNEHQWLVNGNNFSIFTDNFIIRFLCF